MDPLGKQGKRRNSPISRPRSSSFPRALLGSQWIGLDVPCRKSDRRPGLSFFLQTQGGKGRAWQHRPMSKSNQVRWRLSLNEQLSATDQRALYSRTRRSPAILILPSCHRAGLPIGTDCSVPADSPPSGSHPRTLTASLALSRRLADH